MLVGVNYPWIDYGWDFGDPPPAWVGTQHVAEWREKKREQIVADFRAFAEMGLFPVRWFILADGLSYGVGEAAPKKVGGVWVFDPLPGDHPFHIQLREDFEFVLKTCDELKIKFAPSLIDFHWCHQGVVAGADAGVVIGEFATTFNGGWPELKKRDTARTISARLKLIEEKGYPAAFFWSARATDDATTWADADQLDAIGFINASAIGDSNDKRHI